jgi:DNA processing protein
MNPGNSIGERPTPESTDHERLAWLALASVQGIGARRIATLIGRFGSARAVLDAPDAEIAELDGLTLRTARLLRSGGANGARDLVDAAARCGQRLLVPSDPGYPPALRTIPDPPPLLYARGDLALGAERCVAIVGSRAHTRYGAEVAAELGAEVARAGITVVSGMALGLDAVAQTAALDAGGRTIGVLGTGVDLVYPRANARLFTRVLDNGLLLSESPPGERGVPGAFPRRNRLISGLATALVVVEAAEDSGTLITVNCALEQGRDVLAVPGPINSPTSRGTNRLIRDGAVPILEPADLMRALGLKASPSSKADIPFPVHLSADEARVLAALRQDPMHVDEVALSAGMPIGSLLGTLLGLEIGGLAEQLPGSMFRRRLA